MRTLNVLLWKDHHDTSVKQKKKKSMQNGVYTICLLCLKKKKKEGKLRLYIYIFWYMPKETLMMTTTSYQPGIRSSRKRTEGSKGRTEFLL